MQGTGESQPTCHPMLCYSEDQDFCCYIPREQQDSELVAKLIQDKGAAGGCKAYFKAYVDQSTQQLVIVPTVLPAQVW